jgi:glycosyltransferase involved in cell wall biosynthesis
MRKVMIGTPCYDGRLDVWYVNSLINTCKLAAEHDIEITPVWVSFDALVQRARNDTVSIALEMGCDDLVWIDSDIEWKPEWFLKLIDYDLDVVGGTYRKKGDIEEYVLRQTVRRPVDPDTGLMKVDGLGTGFVKMSRRALQYLWTESKKYVDPKDNRERAMIFDVIIEGTDMISEDITAFKRLSNGGFDIWLDTEICCGHSGPKKWTGDFIGWWNRINPQLGTKQL